MTGMPHIVLPATPRTAAAERLKNLQTSFCADEHVQFIPLRRFFEHTGAIAYDGIGGDVLSQSRYLTREFLTACDRGPAQAATHLLDGFGKEGIEHALAGLLTERGSRRFDRDSAERRLREETSRHLDAVNPVASFFFWNRTRREIALAPYALLDVLPT